MRQFRSFLFALVLLINPLGAWSQPQEPLPTQTPPAPLVILPDNDLRSPRSTLATFLAAMDPSEGSIEIERAIKTLDTADIPELVRQERAEEVAVKLYAVLDHIGVTSSKAPANTTVDALQVTQVAGFAIYMDRNGPNWRFSKATVADTPAIFRELEGELSKKDMRELAGATKTWLTIRTYIPEQLKNTTFMIEDWQWFAAICAIVLLFILHRIILLIFRWIIIAALAPRFGLPRTLNLQPLGRPVAVALLATALQLFLLTIDLPMHVYTTAVEWIATVRIVALAVVGIYLVDIFGERLSNRASRSPSTVDDILYPLVQKGLWLLVIIVGTAQILTVHGVNVSGLVAGLGLGGLAFALAAKDTVENIFGSIAILIDQPFRVGDSINVGGVMGVVEQIGLRSTRLRTPDNSLVSMPNSKVIASHVDNLGARQALRTRVVLNLAYDTPPQSVDAFCAGIRELLSSHPKCKQDSSLVFLNELNITGMGILIQFHLVTRDPTEELVLKDKIFLAILTLAQNLQIRLTGAPQELRMMSNQETAADRTPTPTREAAIAAAKQLSVGWKRV